MSITRLQYVTADGVKIFYHSAGSPSSPVLLLLGGFPTSSHQFRDFIPMLSGSYHVIAPDYSGFGFTEVPASRSYEYTFANLATSMLAFLDALSIDKLSLYIFDYGAPVGLRMALQRPESITSIIVQNGNAYFEGFGIPFWTPIHNYWKSNSEADRKVLRDNIFSLAATQSFYTIGEKPDSIIPPETYHLDHALLHRQGVLELNLDLFYDYRTNVDLYPQFQKYLRDGGVPVLVVSGKNDIAFIQAGAEAYKKDAKDVEVHLLDAGHFALELHAKEVADYIFDFKKGKGI
jgi:pimeloyl-ACP methyl ester carboxylesterase